MPQLTVGSAIDKATSLLEAAGVPSQEAATTARCIVASDRWGIGSHGLNAFAVLSFTLYKQAVSIQRPN